MTISRAHLEGLALSLEDEVRNFIVPFVVFSFGEFAALKDFFSRSVGANQLTGSLAILFLYI